MKVVVLKIIDSRTIKAFSMSMVKHLSYDKYITKRDYYIVESFGKSVSLGDEIEIVSSRPFSKRKSWALSGSNLVKKIN